MRTAELLRTALTGVRSNPLRSALTTLGVVIGVASVIAMLALGSGAKAAVEEQFRTLGSDEIQAGAKMDVDDDEVKPAGKILSYQDGLRMRTAVSLVDRVDMEVTGSEKVRFGRASQVMDITGTIASGLDALAAKGEVQPEGHEPGKPLSGRSYLARGRMFTTSEVLGGARVGVLGHDTARHLFAGDDPINQAVWVGRRKVVVIGVLKKLVSTDPSYEGRGKPNESFALPISTAIHDLFEEEPSVQMSIHVTDESRMDEAKAAVATYLRKRHAVVKDVRGKWQDDFVLTTRSEILGAQQEAARTFSLLLAGMAAVALLVGGIGIMNVMLVSVSERTREIGVRMAVGARGRDIVRQFLIEAALIGAAGGLIGTALGLTALPGVAAFFQRPVTLDARSIPLALGVAVVTGIVFGAYPALRASRLDPIEALRYE